MKYLKKYKLFESIYMDYDTISDVNDILSELSDDSIPVSVDARVDGNVIITIGEEFDPVLTFLDQINKVFKVKKYEDAFMRLIEYMNPKNYTLIAFNYDDKHNIRQTYKDFGMGIDLLPKHLMNLDETNFIKLYFKLNKVSESINESKVVTKDEFPLDVDIEEIFYDITDELYHHNFGVDQGGYAFFPSADLTRERRSQMLYDMSFEDDWLNKPIPGLADEYWKEYIMTVEESNKLKLRNSSVEYLFLSDLKPTTNQTTFSRKYDSIEDKTSNFWDLFYENILNGNIKAYPIKFINITLEKTGLETLYECLERIYETTEFRPIGGLRMEDYVDEDNGDIITLYHAELKLCKVSDIEYEMLSKSILAEGVRTQRDSALNSVLISKFS